MENRQEEYITRGAFEEFKKNIDTKFTGYEKLFNLHIQNLENDIKQIKEALEMISGSVSQIATKWDDFLKNDIEDKIIEIIDKKFGKLTIKIIGSILLIGIGVIFRQYLKNIF